MIKTYSALAQIDTFEGRYKYLKIGGVVGESTFGFDRVLNQQFYRSHEWKTVRRHVMLRDNGCDLGISGRDIHDRVLIHHMNPISVDDVVHATDFLLDPEYLITTTHNTHQAIHYGDESLLLIAAVPRRSGDTKLW